MRYFLTFYLMLCFIVSKAQTGHYFLSHRSPGDKRIDHISFDMVQDTNGIIHFATRSGVLTYDGKNWELISCNGAVYALELNDAGEVFWAGANGFGEIARDKFGRLSSSVLSSDDMKDIYQSIALADKTYFMNDEGVFIYENKTVKTIKADYSTGSFTSLFEIFGNPYLTTDQGKIFKIDDLKLSRPDFQLQDGMDITFSCGTEDKFIIATADSKLFICNRDFSIEEIKTKEDDYINASVIINGVSIDKNFVALGTLRGGVIVLNLESKSIEEIINYNTGLPDNEVFSLLVDREKNIWVSHDYGFSRIAPFAPFRSYSYYDNLKGNLLCALSVNDEVYVGTSLGLFKLSKEEFYEEMVYYEDAPIKRIISPENNQPLNNKSEKELTTPLQVEKQTTEEPEKKRKGFLRFLKRNRSKVEDIPESTVGESSAKVPDQPALDVKPQLPKEEYVIQRLRKTQKVLRSANFAYKKVKGIDAKVTHLAITGNKLIAAGLGGLFEVDDLTAKTILPEPVRVLFAVGDTMLLSSTYNDKVLTLRQTGLDWKVTNELDNPDDQLSYIFQGLPGELWLCGMENIYRLEKNNTNSILSIIQFNNPNFSKTIGAYYRNQVVFVNANGFFRYDAKEKAIIKVDSLPSPKTYFVSGDGIWYHDGFTWSTLGQIKSNKNTNLLNLCGDIRFIGPDHGSENLWIINENNELYKFMATDFLFNVNPFPLFLKTLSQSGNPVTKRKRMVINQDDGPVEIEVVQASFTGDLSVEYRYWLKGINETWSEWSNRNDQINFTYLPQGNYTLSVQSRDTFGKISEVEAIHFQVQPAYWKTPWFYAMEFTLFALLVLLSFKLSLRYRFISRVLSLLTIILLIEFIQTIIGFSFAKNSSPIIDFLVQVIVALIILPVEGFLRNLMFKSMGSNSRLFDVIAELDRQQKGKK